MKRHQGERRGYDALIDTAEITIGDFTYFYRFAGEPRAGALPLVLIHGLGVSSDYWVRLIPWLAAWRPVYALDLPGFGLTEDPQGIFNTVELTRGVREWLGALGIDRTHILSHSQGAQIALELAVTAPGLVASLVLAGATIGERDPSLPRMALRLLRDVPREDRSLLPVASRGYLRAGVSRMLVTNHLLNHEDSVATIGRLQLPTLIVRGEHDPIVTPWSVEQLAGAAPHARTVTIPAAAHGLHWGAALPLARLVNTFLDEVEGTP